MKTDLKRHKKGAHSACIDTDVIIRLLVNDDKKKQETAASLFEKVAAGSLTLIAPYTVIADAVYVLSSPRLYNLSREMIRDLLSSLIRWPSFKLEHKPAVLAALELYSAVHLDFGDAMLISFARHQSTPRLYSYDRDFDAVADIKRIEP